MLNTPVPLWTLLAAVLALIAVIVLAARALTRAGDTLIVQLSDFISAAAIARHAERLLEDLIRAEPERAEIYDFVRVDLARFGESLELHLSTLQAAADGLPPREVLRRVRREREVADRRRREQGDRSDPGA